MTVYDAVYEGRRQRFANAAGAHAARRFEVVGASAAPRPIGPVPSSTARSVAAASAVPAAAAASHEQHGAACGCPATVVPETTSKTAAKDAVGPLATTTCKPWLRTERNEKYFEACMTIAEEIGPIDSAKKAFRILGEAVGSEDQEVFGAMYLDTHLYLRGLAETARGEVDAVMAPIGPTLRLAITEGAQGVLIFHCHPTLYTQPSESDVEVTKSFQKACEALNLFFVDHIIVGGKKSFYSFADEGYLE